jgi:hypothetical protein
VLGGSGRPVISFVKRTTARARDWMLVDVADARAVASDRRISVARYHRWRNILAQRITIDGAQCDYVHDAISASAPAMIVYRPATARLLCWWAVGCG